MLVLHDERTVGEGPCPICGAPVVRVVDEFFRLVTLDQAPAEGGAWIWGAEVDGLGDQPDPPVRARRATENDPPGPRWQQHACP